MRNFESFKLKHGPGKAKLSELQSDIMRYVSDAERRIAGVSFRAAHDFRSGFDSTRPAFEEQVKVMQDYFTETDQLAEFLIDRQGQYSQTPNGLLFKRDRDAEAFNKQVDALAHLQEQINSLRHTALDGDSRNNAARLCTTITCPVGGDTDSLT